MVFLVPLKAQSQRVQSLTAARDRMLSLQHPLFQLAHQ
jgi:hypothetical protein